MWRQVGSVEVVFHARPRKHCCARAILKTSRGEFETAATLTPSSLAPLVVCNSAYFGMFGPKSVRSKERVRDSEHCLRKRSWRILTESVTMLCLVWHNSWRPCLGSRAVCWRRDAVWSNWARVKQSPAPSNCLHGAHFLSIQRRTTVCDWSSHLRMLSVRFSDFQLLQCEHWDAVHLNDISPPLTQWTETCVHSVESLFTLVSLLCFICYTYASHASCFEQGFVHIFSYICIHLPSSVYSESGCLQISPVSQVKKVDV